MDKSEWDNLMDEFRAQFAQRIIQSVWMQDDGSLEIDAFLGRAFSFSRVTPDCSTYNVILAVLEELGCKMPPNRAWSQPYEPPQNPEEYISPDSLERMAFQIGLFKRIEMLEDGSVICWGTNSKGGDLDFPFSAGTPHIAMLEKHIGPLKPGQVFLFPKREEAGSPE
jgi:hypothetical protein